MSEEKRRDIKKSDCWKTPRWLMRHFIDHYDPCPSNFKEDYFHKSGLEKNWRKSRASYVNPPYSQPKLWVDKAIEQQNKGVDVVMLLRCDPSTKWYKKLVEADAHFCYFNERLKFSESKGSPNFASMLVFLEGKHES